MISFFSDCKEKIPDALQEDVFAQALFAEEEVSSRIMPRATASS